MARTVEVFDLATRLSARRFAVDVKDANTLHPGRFIGHCPRPHEMAEFERNNPDLVREARARIRARRGVPA